MQVAAFLSDLTSLQICVSVLNIANQHHIGLLNDCRTPKLLLLSSPQDLERLKG
jgi:hypothetical protein